MRRNLRLGLTSCVLLIFVSSYAAPNISVSAQTSADKAPPRVTFGSSLKRPREGTRGRVGPTAQRTPAGEERPQSEDVIRIDTSLVVTDVLVTDASGKRYIKGLTKDDFAVFEDGQPQDIVAFTLGDDAARLPRSIVLIFDRSDSQLAYLEASVEAAKKLVNQLAPTDEMAIVTDDVELAAGFTRDKKRLKSTLDSLKKFTLKGYRTRSMQFSALLATLRELIDVGKRRPIIILQTDGDEVGRLSGWPPVAGEQLSAYGYDMNDVYAEAERARAKIYAVVPNERLLGLPEQEVGRRARLTLQKRREASLKTQDMWYGMRRVPERKADPTAHSFEIPRHGLDELRAKSEKRAVETLVAGQVAAARVAELTGGWASFLERPEETDAVYGRILADINQRYVIGYYPSNKMQDGKLREVRVEVRGHPEYMVQGRRSYYSAPR